MVRGAKRQSKNIKSSRRIQTIKQTQIRVLPAELRQTEGGKQILKALMRTEAGALFRACTLTEACLQDATLAAASYSPSWWQIKTSSIYRNASHRIFLLGDP